MSVIVMRPALLGAIAKFASTDETRFNLHGVYFDKAEVVACDGHRLVRVDIGACFDAFEGTQLSSHEPFLVPLDLVRSVVAGAKEIRANSLHIGAADGRIRIDMFSGGKAICTIGATAPVVTYPSINQVMVTTRNGDAPTDETFNPRLLADMAPVMDACNAHGLTITGWGESPSPMQFEANGVRFVVMPMRCR